MFRAPRGMADVLPDDQPRWRRIQQVASDLAERYGFRRIDTPIVELTDVFRRSVGETSDVVEKEMYTFHDRGNDSLTLRPEGTAAICRAFLEHGMASWPQPVKLYTVGPMFRYDRPQAGRYRQFHQFDVETIGESDAAADAELIDLFARFLRDLGLSATLSLNSIGDDVGGGPEYQRALIGYFRQFEADLCSECRRRLAKNPLRLLDCKNPTCHAIGDGAPRTVDYLGPAAEAHF
ncbi:MAG: histidine--tRNA ligase, partial [Dehalococcoidia bacterium]|nr:histidine--tRNA ligase [Dehalococcoidia bacterium]